MSPVNISKTEQFHHEYKTWTRLLEFFKQENYFMKTRLSEVVDHSADRDFLDLAEQFQNRFLLKDEYIDELRHDIYKQGQLLTHTADILPGHKLVKTQEKLRNEMEYFEKDFNVLKNEFNKYLAAIL